VRAGPFLFFFFIPGNRPSFPFVPLFSERGEVSLSSFSSHGGGEELFLLFSFVV